MRHSNSAIMSEVYPGFRFFHTLSQVAAVKNTLQADGCQHKEALNNPCVTSLGAALET